MSPQSVFMRYRTQLPALHCRKSQMQLPRASWAAKATGFIWLLAAAPPGLLGCLTALPCPPLRCAPAGILYCWHT